MIDSVQKTCICGVAFRPGGLSAFCDQPAQDFADCLVDGTDVFGASASALRNEVLHAAKDEERLDRIESFLLEQLRIRPEEDALIRDLLKDVANGSNITTVRARYGLSQRRLFDLFDRLLEFAPNCFLGSNASLRLWMHWKIVAHGATWRSNMGSPIRPTWSESFSSFQGSLPQGINH